MMDETRKRPYVDDVPNGSADINFETGTLEERQSPRKRRRHSSGCSLDLNSDDVNGIGNKTVSFTLKSDSDSEAESGWNNAEIASVTSPLETPVEYVESRLLFNPVDFAKDLALKAFRRVDSTASELNCLADPNLSENVVETPDDAIARDPFSSLGSRGFIRTEGIGIGSDTKRLVSTPGSDVLSPSDIFKGNLHALKSHDNTMKERFVKPVVSKQSSNDLEWIDACPDWLRDDYFDKEMAKIDSGLPRQSSKLSLVDKAEENPPLLSSDDAPSRDKFETIVAEPESREFSRRERKKSVTLVVLPAESDELDDDTTSANSLGVFEPDKDLIDAQSSASRPKRKKLKIRRRHCSRGKMGPPAYYRNQPSHVEDGEESREDEEVFAKEQDFSLKGRGKNWPPPNVPKYQAQAAVSTDAPPEASRLIDDASSTQEYELSLSQENTTSEVLSVRDQNHNDDMHLNSMPSYSNEKEKPVEVTAGGHGTADEQPKPKDSETSCSSVGGLDIGPAEISEEQIRTDAPVSVDVPEVDIGDGQLNFERDVGTEGRKPQLDVMGSEKLETVPMEEGSNLESNVVSDATPYEEVDAAVVNSGNETNPSTSVTTSPGAPNITRSTSKLSLAKIASLQRDAQNIANILGGSNVDVIYEKLNERRKEDNRVEAVMNDILEGNIVVEDRSGNEGSAIEGVLNTVGTSVGEEEVDILADTEVILKKLQTEHGIEDVDPNEVFGLVEASAEFVNGRTNRINRVISGILSGRQTDNRTVHDIKNNDDEDLFLHDVDQLVKKFPNVDQFQIYTLLDAHRGENDRVDVVQNELTNGRAPVENSGVKEVAAAEVVNQDPLYDDMIRVARLFPHKDRNEIYAYLEAHHEEADRVQVVTEEFLRMSQEGEDVEVMRGEEPAPASRPPSATAASESRDTLDISLEEQVQNLSAIFPDCDPNYLYEQLEVLKNDPERVKNLASTLFDRRTYPKKKDVLEEQRKHEDRLKVCGMLSTFRLNEFLELFPDPVAVFCSEEKSVSESYKKHVYVHLMNTFPYLREEHIKTTMEKHTGHLTTTLKELEEEVANGDLRTKRSRSAYPQKFLKKKRSISDQMTFPEEPDEYFYKELAFTRNEVKIKDHLETQKKVRENKIERAKKNGELYECPCCYEDECLFEDMKACVDGHLCCAECVRRSAEENIGSSKLTFPCLHGDCEEEYTMKTLQEVLPSNVFSGLLNKIQEEEVKQAGIENLVSCPFCSFATIMEDENDKVLRCQNPDCLKESCRLCQEPNHIPLKCEEVEKQGQTNMRTYIENKISEAMIRTCWKCKKRFYKIEGCNKMRCSCGATMCYVCRAPNIDYDHFGNPHDKNACPPQTDIYELHRKEMEKAGLLAKKEYEDNHPDIAAGLKFDPLEHVKDATTARHPSGYPPAYYDEDDEDDEEDDSDFSNDEYDRYGDRRRRYHDYYDEEEDEEYY
ncbi:uncharacterized protein LOC135485687 [Lineus longissimus]|uniref:uncharacterized protein LOC135485687 n=1 Tax=Lineus longissimus TaxID=88925 RepID=UPI002B4E7F72